MVVCMMASNNKGKKKVADKGKKKVADKGKKKLAVEKGKGKQKGKGKSQKTTLRDEDIEEEEDEETTLNREIIEQPVQVRQIIRKPRGPSSGIYGSHKPDKPRRINISNGHIEDNEAKKTLLAMVREKWPIGHYTFSDIDQHNSKWLGERVKEFKGYYKHEKGQSRTKAVEIIEKHIKNCIRRTMNELKSSVEAKVKEGHKDRMALKPAYWPRRFWADVLKYWDTNEGHLHRANVGAKNRKLVEKLHSAGARSFNAVKKIRYASILESMPVEVTQTGDRDEPLDWWLEAIGVPKGQKPKKNYVVGFPESRASDLIPTLATRYRDSTRGQAGSSSSAPTQETILPDNMYLPMVRNILNDMRVDPLKFTHELSAEEMAQFAKTAMEASDPSADQSKRVEWNQLICSEAVHIVATLIEDLNTRKEKLDELERERLALEGRDYTDPDEATASEEEEDEVPNDEEADPQDGSDTSVSVD